MKLKAVIMDVDGCLCDTSSITHHVDKTHKDYVGKNLEAFHTESMSCPPRQDMEEAWRKAKRDGCVLIVLTGRPERWRTETSWWLLRNHFIADNQLHRPEGDKRPAWEFKQEVLLALREHYNIVHAYDDDPRVAAMYERNGQAHTLVPGWPTLKGEPILPATEEPDTGEGAGLVAA